MRIARWRGAAVAVGIAAVAGVAAYGQSGLANDSRDGSGRDNRRKARNVIFFIGDGMGVSTVTAARIYSVGLDGQLVVGQFPHTALSKTYSADSIPPDSAPTMSTMMTGINTNQSVIGFGDGGGSVPHLPHARPGRVAGTSLDPRGNAMA